MQAQNAVFFSGFMLIFGWKHLVFDVAPFLAAAAVDNHRIFIPTNRDFAHESGLHQPLNLKTGKQRW